MGEVQITWRSSDSSLLGSAQGEQSWTVVKFSDLLIACHAYVFLQGPVCVHLAFHLNIFCTKEAES